jgi:hypothetical protein
LLLTTHHFRSWLDDLFTILANPWLYWPVIAAVLGIVARWWRKSRRLAKKRFVSRAAQGWLTVSAAIDVVSVAEHVDSDGKKYFLAALTYFYKRPNLEMGDYQREFTQKAVAQEWVKQFKNRHVMVHVNPKNPADSILLDDDLEGLESHQTQGIEIPTLPGQKLTISEPLPPLSPRYRFLSAIGELLSLSGLAGSAVLLTASFFNEGKTYPHWLFWTGGGVLALSFLLMIVVQFQFRSNESAKSILRTYKPWYTAWIRWSPEVSAAAISIGAIIERHRTGLPMNLQLWMTRIDSHLPYLLACFFFLSCASFYTSVQRSQEQIRLPVGGV